MEVILKEDIINLGFKDDIVTVKDGYGRNYLIPQKKAIIASESAKKMLAEELRQRAHKLEAIKQEAQALGQKIDGMHLEIKAKTSKYGVIFGSVTNIQLAEALGNSLGSWCRCWRLRIDDGVILRDDGEGDRHDHLTV